MKKYIYLSLFLIIAVFVGNRVLNHLHAWIGVLIILSTIIYFFYKLIKNLKDEKIDSRNEVNTNISVLEQKIEEQKKNNELERLKTEQALIQSRGLTKEILYKQFIDKWDGKTPIYGAIPDLIKVQK